MARQQLRPQVALPQPESRERNANMIPIKIQCGCGQHYAFDVAPIGGEVGVEVRCPACGADGVGATNIAIANYKESQLVPADRLQVHSPRSESAITSPSDRISGQVPSPRSGSKRSRIRWRTPTLVALGLSLTGLVVVLAGRGRIGIPHSTARNGAPVDPYPRSLAALNAWYVEPPQGQNAAPSFLQAFVTIQIAPGAGSALPFLGKGTLPPPGTPLSPLQTSAIAGVVHANINALELLARGSTQEQCRYPVDLTLGYEALFPHLAGIRRALALLELSAVWHGDAGGGKQAAADLVAALALARSLENEPSLFSQSIRATGISTVVGTWEWTVNRTPIRGEDLDALMKAFRRMETIESRGEGFNRGFAAEHTIWMTLLDAPEKLVQAMSVPGVDLAPDERDSTFAHLRSDGPLKKEHVAVQNAFGLTMVARSASFPDRLKTDAVIHRLLADAKTRKNTTLQDFLSGLAGKTAKEAESLARLRQGMVSVALEQFRAAHQDVYPTDLSQLNPDYLTGPVTDPFDGDPMQYTRVGSGYVLSSAGQSTRGSPGGSHDIRFSVVAGGSKNSRR